MTWLQLFRRAWAAWKLSRREFPLCHNCSSPLTNEELKFHGKQCWCFDCGESQRLKDEERQRKTENNIPWNSIQGSLAQLLGGLGNTLPFQQAMNWQQQIQQENTARALGLDQQQQQQNLFARGLSPEELSQLLGKFNQGQKQ